MAKRGYPGSGPSWNALRLSGPIHELLPRRGIFSEAEVYLIRASHNSERYFLHNSDHLLLNVLLISFVTRQDRGSRKVPTGDYTPEPWSRYYFRRGRRSPCDSGGYAVPFTNCREEVFSETQKI